MELKQEVLDAIASKKFIYATHFNKRKNERNLQQIDIFSAIKDGQVIEHIEAINLGEKYLIYAEQNGKIFHVSLAYNNNTVSFITTYVPNADPGHENDFKSDLKTRNKPYL